MRLNQLGMWTERERGRGGGGEGERFELVCLHCRFAFVEFALSESVPIALQYNGAMFGDRPIK